MIQRILPSKKMSMPVPEDGDQVYELNQHRRLKERNQFTLNSHVLSKLNNSSTSKNERVQDNSFLFSTYNNESE